MIAEPLVWVAEKPTTGDVRRPSQSRKSHRKSRAGCVTCKARRVKCDERHPICGPCGLRGTDCRFVSARGLPKGDVRKPSVLIQPSHKKYQPESVEGWQRLGTGDVQQQRPHQSEPFSRSLEEDEEEHQTIGSIYRADEAQQAFLREHAEPAKYKRTPSLLPSKTTISTLAQESVLGIHAVSTHIASLVSSSTRNADSSNTLPFLISHFTQYSCTTLSSYTGQVIMRKKIPELLLRHKFLLHTVLAFSASHLEYLQSCARGQRCETRMATTASWHSERALRLYGNKISWYQAKATNKEKIQDADTWFQLLSGDNTGTSSIEEREDMDAMVACCVMLTSLFFHCPWGEAVTSWTKSILPSAVKEETTCSFLSELPQLHCHDRATAPTCGETLRDLGSRSGSPAGVTIQNATAQMNWLTTITGMAILLSLPSFQRNLQDSIWLPFFREANDQHYPQLNGLCSDVDENLLSNLPSAQYDLEDASTGFIPTKAGNIECSNIRDPGRADAQPSNSSKLPKLHRLSNTLARSQSPQVRQQHELMHPVISHLVYLISLDPADLNNFSPIISFPSRLPSDFPTLFKTNHWGAPARLNECSLSMSGKYDEQSTSWSSNSSPSTIPTPHSDPQLPMQEPRPPCFDIQSNDLYNAFASTMPIPPSTKLVHAYSEHASHIYNLSDLKLDINFPATVDQLFRSQTQSPNIGFDSFLSTDMDVGAFQPDIVSASLETGTQQGSSDFPFSPFASYQTSNFSTSASTSTAPSIAASNSTFTHTSSGSVNHHSYPSAAPQHQQTQPHLTAPAMACPYSTEPQSHTPILPLLLLGYWFTTLAVVPHWWCAERGRLESGVVLEALLSAVMPSHGSGSVVATDEDEFSLAEREAVWEFMAWRRGRMGI